MSDTVIREQEATEIYHNKFGDIVISQSEDPSLSDGRFVVIQQVFLGQIIETLSKIKTKQEGQE